MTNKRDSSHNNWSEMAQYWSAIGQPLVSRWSFWPSSLAVLSGFWVFRRRAAACVIYRTRISWWHGRLVGGRHSICGNTQWYTASLWLDFFGKNWSQFDDGWHCLSPPSCSIGTEIVMLVLYTQKHVARQPLTVCYWYFTHIFDWL